MTDRTLTVTKQQDGTYRAEKQQEALYDVLQSANREISGRIRGGITGDDYA